MPNLPTPHSSSLAPQPGGILPTRRFWDGRKIAGVRAGLAGTSAGTVVAAVLALAPGGLPIWATAALAGVSTVAAIVLTWGIVERVARSLAQ